MDKREWDDVEDAGEVHCDKDCGAKEVPETIEDFVLAYNHWRYHALMFGCAHGR